jgi:acyl dehydratase
MADTTNMATWTPSEIDLFLFSAALWLPHRIHYDRDFAREDGHPDLVVHGPLQIARLLECTAAWTGPGRECVTRAAFRHVAPAVVGESLRFTVVPVPERSDHAPHVREVEGTVEVIEGARKGTITTTGKIMLTGPDATGGSEVVEVGDV